MKVYVVINSHQHGLGEAVEVDAEVFSTRDKARKAMEDKGLNTLESYKHHWIVTISKSAYQAHSIISQTTKVRRGIISIL